MTPGTLNLVCPQGATFTQQLIYQIDDVAVNLTGYTARMQVREFYNSKTPLVSLTTENGGIALGGATGQIDIEIDATATAAFVPKKYVYDLELVSNQNVYRLVQGTFTVTPEVTR